MRCFSRFLCVCALGAVPLVGCDGVGGEGGTGGVAGTAGGGGTDPCAGVSCDDENPCTDDSCGPGGACFFVDNDGPCDDQSVCTEPDQCVNGLCAGPAISCVDGNPCTLDLCDDTIGCVFAPASNPCDDGDVCTSGDICADGVCTPGEALDCDDQSSCTSDSCEPGLGCTYGYLCDRHATCQAGACECVPGYEGDGYSCIEVHVCADGHCSSMENVTGCPEDCDHDLVIVVEEAIAELVEPGLRLYLNDLDNAGYLARVEPWTPGTAEQLKSFIFSQIEAYDVEGALLIGNLPAAWYEQDLFCAIWDMSQTPAVCLEYQHEEFPTDIFLQDRDAVWADSDNDGIYDFHTALELDIFVSRLQTLPDPEKCIKTDKFPACVESYDPGNPFYASDQCVRACPSRLAKQRWGQVDVDVECCGPYFLNKYFERVHDFRNYGPLLAPSALLFMDDDWAHMTGHELFGLGSLYSSVAVIAEPVDRSPGVIHTTTQLDEYADFLTETGAEFVYQMIHSGSQNLYFRTCGEWTDDCFEGEPNPWPECYAPCEGDEDCCGCSSLGCVDQTCVGAECDGNAPPAPCGQSCSDDADCCHCSRMYCGPDGICVSPWRCKWSFSEPIHRTSIGPRPDLGPDIPMELGQMHYDLKCSFLNMYDCNAARFTVPNLAMAFTVQSTYGLAIVGSTKVGGMYDGTPFHNNLAAGTPWGESFRLWYNEVGSKSDLFTLGMGIMGDPLLTVSRTSAEFLQATHGGSREADFKLFERIDWLPSEPLDTYEDYKKANPHFFRP